MKRRGISPPTPSLAMGANGARRVAPLRSHWRGAVAHVRDMGTNGSAESVRKIDIDP